MYDRILVAIDASPDSPDDSLNRTTQFAKMAGGTVHLLHVARGHIIPTDIAAGAALLDPSGAATGVAAAVSV
jgi:nucleotide-binding universal stress UspA family protein